MGIVWQEPPARRKTGPKRGSKPSRLSSWMGPLKTVMKKKGKWARIAVKANPSAASQLAFYLKVGRVHRPDGRWEFVSRPLPRGEGWGVWARYMGRAKKEEGEP